MQMFPSMNRTGGTQKRIAHIISQRCIVTNKEVMHIK